MCSQSKIQLLTAQTLGHHKPWLLQRQLPSQSLYNVELEAPPTQCGLHMLLHTIVAVMA